MLDDLGLISSLKNAEFALNARVLMRKERKQLSLFCRAALT